MNTKVLTGRCTCGTVEYRLTHSPLYVHACHCHKCQETSQSAYGITTIILDHEIEIDWSKLVRTSSAHSSKQTLYCCRLCSDHLLTTALNHPATALLKTSSLDDASQLTVDAHIFVNRKQSELVIPSKIPQFQTFYSRENDWPLERLERLNKALLLRNNAGSAELRN